MDRIIRFPEARQMSGLSRSTMWRLEQEGLFPKRVKISRGIVGWRLLEVQAWIAARSENIPVPPMDDATVRASRKAK